MKMRWLLIGGPTVVGVIVGIVVIVSLVETPCACEEGILTVDQELLARVEAYRKRVAAFDDEHGEKTCPPKPDAPFVLECDPATRAMTLRHPGRDGRFGTADDRSFVLSRPAPDLPPTS